MKYNWMEQVTEELDRRNESQREFHGYVVEDQHYEFAQWLIREFDARGFRHD